MSRGSQETVALLVAYEGAQYAGFQRQRPGLDTVQGRLEEAVSCLVGRPVALAPSGRTDAGVHAVGQVVSFPGPLSVPLERLPHALQRHLPEDIAVLGAARAPAGFHARFSARSKVYQYTIWRGPLQSPFLRRYAWHRPGPLDGQAAARAADLLTGCRDFAAFQASGRPARDTVRTVSRCEWREDGPFLRVVVEADGFLYKMVRTIVGTLVEVARGRWAPQEVADILASRDRRRAGPAAPPQGLCLLAVRYDPPLTFLPEGPQAAILDSFPLVR